MSVPLRGRRKEQVRERLPELQTLVESVPRAFEAAGERRMKQVPRAWRTLVARMRRDVVTAAKARSAERGLSDEERRGYEWSAKIMRVCDMFRYLKQRILSDIGFDEGATLSSMLLVERALLQLDLELQDGGSRDGREDRDENAYRVRRALTALSRADDDVGMRKLRALQTIGCLSLTAHVPDTSDVERSVEECRSMLPEGSFDEEKHRDFLWVDHPALSAARAHSELVQIDPRFSQLDPIEILEELANVDAKATGGKEADGEGRLGPTRTLAALAVRCGALGYEQRAGEGFDQAVARARNNLLVTRSRIRKAIREFPGQRPAADAPPGGSGRRSRRAPRSPR